MINSSDTRILWLVASGGDVGHGLKVDTCAVAFFLAQEKTSMSRPIRKRINYLKDTAILSRIIAATQIDDTRSHRWQTKVLETGQKLIALLNEGDLTSGDEKETRRSE